MDDEALTALLIAAVNRIQTASGHTVIPIARTTCPIKDLPDFDSLLGLETTLELEAQLGPIGSDNVFVNDTGTRALTIGEIVAALKQRLAVRSLQ